MYEGLKLLIAEPYRVPKINEFIDGFKYEVWSDGYWEDSIEDFYGWYEYKFNKG